jgi:hypothetical protein
MTSFLIPYVKVTVDVCKAANKNPEYEDDTNKNLNKILYHIKELSKWTGIKPGKWTEGMTYAGFNSDIGDRAKQFLDSVGIAIRARNRVITARKDSLIGRMRDEMGEEEFQNLRDMNYNENLANIVLNRLNTNKIYDAGRKFIQKADPVFMRPGSRAGRAHFYAPFKQLGNLRIDTLLFNIMAIWLMVGALFVTLYFNVLKRFIVFLETLNIPIWRKYGRELLQI